MGRQRTTHRGTVERGARGGLEAKRFVWGDDHVPDGQVMANTWQGIFPTRIR